MPLSGGQTFAGYRIVRLLGSGGMGEVYLVEHPRLPRHNALKVLPADVSADPEYRARFAREANLASKLWHPHIVSVHDRGEHEGQLWISMDFVDGLDAARLLASRYPDGMPTDQVVRIVTAVASALDYAHKQGLLHRDVKPANIMLTHLDDDDDDDQRILLTDFGIARSLGDISGLTATNMTMGTVAYAAPEQLMGEELDGRADQYALAATAYHLLTGAQLFPHSNPAVVIGRHLNAMPPALADSRLELRGLDPVFAVALAKAPEDRFPRCLDFARSLAELPSEHSSSYSTAATKPAPAARFRKPHAHPTQAAASHKRWPIAAAGIGVFVLAAAAVLVWGPWQQRSSTSAETPAATPSTATAQPPATPSAALPPPARTTTSPPKLTPAFRTAFPACYDSVSVAEKPSSAGLLCHGHWFENLTWSSWGPDAADGAGVEAIKDCTPSCATGELSRNPVEIHLAGPAPPPADSGCPSEVRYYTQLIVAYPTTLPPEFSAGVPGGPISERYNGMPSYRWNELIPHCY